MDHTHFNQAPYDMFIVLLHIHSAWKLSKQSSCLTCETLSKSKQKWNYLFTVMLYYFLGKQRSPYALSTTGDGLEDQEGDSRYLVLVFPPHVVQIHRCHLQNLLYHFIFIHLIHLLRSSIHNAVCHCRLKWFPGVPGMFKCQFKGCMDIDLRLKVSPPLSGRCKCCPYHL